MQIGCIVLAAGKSQRFGSSKLCAQLCGSPVLQHTLNAVLAAAFDRRVCVVSAEETEKLCRECGMPAVRYEGGPLSASIRTGLQTMKDMDGCMFVNGDQPLLESRSMERMIREFCREPYAILRLAWQGQAASPVIFPRESFDALEALEGDRGGSQVIRSGKFTVHTLEAEYASELLDVDTQDLFRQAEEILRCRGINK